MLHLLNGISGTMQCQLIKYRIRCVNVALSPIIFVDYECGFRTRTRNPAQTGTCNVQPPNTRKESRFHPCDKINWMSFFILFALPFCRILTASSSSNSDHSTAQSIEPYIRVGKQFIQFLFGLHWILRIDYVRPGQQVVWLLRLEKMSVKSRAPTLPHKAFENRFMFRRLPTEAASTSEAVAQKRKLCFASLFSIRFNRI